MRRTVVLAVAFAFAAAASGEPRRSSRKPQAVRDDAQYPAFEFNLGAAAGSLGGQSYFEIQAAVNTLFLPWLVWRNAPFYRFRSNQDGALGLDSSVLGRIGLAQGFGLDVGGGYRLTTVSAMNAPFVEAHLGVSLPNFSVGLGVKYLLNSVVRAGASNDLLYSIGASAGARL